ncbi:hypothetical protein FGO68_gene368 [Halteria grandinella]|uniref:Uncharacterized protein n=1 Tax=Halteria grandinella TaxID=5974 RepID=A0A8J8NTC7_HALGN|nr:hypothetical protein FGO68_gene368 [Halteria grandinella]
MSIKKYNLLSIHTEHRICQKLISHRMDPIEQSMLFVQKMKSVPQIFRAICFSIRSSYQYLKKSALP